MDTKVESAVTAALHDTRAGVENRTSTDAATKNVKQGNDQQTELPAKTLSKTEEDATPQLPGIMSVGLAEPMNCSVAVDVCESSFPKEANSIHDNIYGHFLNSSRTTASSDTDDSKRSIDSFNVYCSKCENVYTFAVENCYVPAFPPVCRGFCQRFGELKHCDAKLYEIWMANHMACYVYYA